MLKGNQVYYYFISYVAITALCLDKLFKHETDKKIDEHKDKRKM